MAERHKDLLNQAKRDLRHARHALRDEDHEWSCFAAQQAAEKAVKALYQKLGAEAWGHAVSILLGKLPKEFCADTRLINQAKELDKYYIPARYPNAHPEGPLSSILQRKRQKGLSVTVRQLSPFVKISYFNRDEVDKALKSYIQRLYDENPDIEKIVVFGSFVRDECVPGSDIDLLIILKRSELPFLNRIPLYIPSYFPVGVDVFPYTKDEIKIMLGEGNFFIKTALEEGKEVSEF